MDYHPNNMFCIIRASCEALYSSAIDSIGNNLTHLESNENYSMTGTEKFVNSGWIWPEGMGPPGLAPINSSTVTFGKPGTYDYVCVIHPRMNGVVTVTEKSSSFHFF